MMNAWVLLMMMLMMRVREEEWGGRELVRALREKNHVCLVFSWSRSLLEGGGEGER